MAEKLYLNPNTDSENWKYVTKKLEEVIISKQSLININLIYCFYKE